MGYMYENGRGVRLDYQRAERYYRHALESNPHDTANSVSGNMPIDRTQMMDCDGELYCISSCFLCPKPRRWYVKSP